MVEQFTNSRDIRRYQIFYEYIFDTSRLLQENASLANEFRLSLLRRVLSYGLSWKAPELRQRVIQWILSGPHVLNNDYQMIRSSIGQLLFSTLIWKDKSIVDISHPFAVDVMAQIHDKYESMTDEDGKKHLFKTILYSLNKIISFGVSSTWRWLPVLVSLTLKPNYLTLKLNLIRCNCIDCSYGKPPRPNMRMMKKWTK